MTYTVIMYSDPDCLRFTRRVEADDPDQAVERAVLGIESEGEYDRTGLVVVEILDPVFESCMESPFTAFAMDCPGLDIPNR